MSSLPPSSGILETSPDGGEFQDIMPDLTIPHESDDGVLMNKYDLLCPRGCRSVILKCGVAQLVKRSGIEMDLPYLHPTPELLPELPAKAHWWLVAPSPMVFENIGFSQSVTGGTTASLRPVKFLTCADCDVGPLGWCEEGGREFWLACSRVKYATPART